MTGYWLRIQNFPYPGEGNLSPAVAQDPAPRARDRPGTDEAGEHMTTIKELKKRWMEDPEFREEYARADEEFALVEALVCARAAANLTQAQLAQRLGTTQSAIARLEGGKVSPSFATLRRYAEATGTRLTVGLVPADGLGAQRDLKNRGGSTSVLAPKS